MLYHDVRNMREHGDEMRDDQYQEAVEDLAKRMEQSGLTQAGGSSDSLWKDWRDLARWIAQRVGRQLRLTPEAQAPLTEEAPEGQAEPAPAPEDGKELVGAVVTGTQANLYLYLVWDSLCDSQIGNPEITCVCGPTSRSTPNLSFRLEFNLKEGTMSGTITGSTEMLGERYEDTPQGDVFRAWIEAKVYDGWVNPDTGKFGGTMTVTVRHHLE